MRFCARVSGWILLLSLLSLGGGCRYVANRYYDMRDVVAVGVGVTGENPRTGIVPPSLGLYLEATDWLHLGAIHYNGYTAELDLRGTFVGPECETRFGLLWWQMIRKNQSYKDACYMNKFKDEDFPWCHRMESLGMRHGGHPAKRLHYEHYRQYMIRGTGLLHRGWQYWEYAGFEAALCEPFVTHAGVMIRAGFDLSEVADAVLGLACIDFKHDDLNRDEFWIFCDHPCWMWGQKMVPVRRPTSLEPEEDALRGKLPEAPKSELREEINSEEPKVEIIPPAEAAPVAPPEAK